MPPDDGETVLHTVAHGHAKMSKARLTANDPARAGRAPELPAFGHVERIHNRGSVDGLTAVGAVSHLSPAVVDIGRCACVDAIPDDVRGIANQRASGRFPLRPIDAVARNDSTRSRSPRSPARNTYAVGRGCLPARAYLPTLDR